MNNNRVTILLESAEKIGLMSTLAELGDNMQFNIPLLLKICDNSIEVLKLSENVSDELKRNGVATIMELTNALMSEDGIEALRNLDNDSIYEIQTKLLNLAYDELDDENKKNFWITFIELNSELLSELE